jgi:hypothetical protein
VPAAAVTVVTPALVTSPPAFAAYSARFLLSRSAPVSAGFALSRFVLLVMAADDI